MSNGDTCSPSVRATLPLESSITDTVLVRMTPEMRAQSGLAELSRLSVEQAVELVRSMIPKAPPRGPASSAPPSHAPAAAITTAATPPPTRQ